MTRLPNWLEHRALTDPDHPALFWGGEAVSFRDLARRAAVTGARLRTLGVRRGDRVAVLAGTRPEFVEILHGAMRIGAILVPLHRRLTAGEIEPQLRAAGASIVLYDAATRQTVAGIDRAACPTRAAIDPAGLDGDPRLTDIAEAGGADDPPIDLDAVHSILFTSGSSGRSKGVQLTYGNHFWSAVGSAFNLGVHADDRWLACMPLCHVGGLAILLRSAIYGTSVVLQDGFDAVRVNASIDAERVSIVSVVATMLRRMLDARGARPYPPSLRCVLLGGGPAPAALLEDCAARGLPVMPTYGLTEAASQVTTLSPRDARRKPGSAGRPLGVTEVSLLGPDGPVPDGDIGEIAVRGPTVSPGYVDDAAPRAGDAGWFSTGDLGRFDADGFLYVVGRRDDLIISGGENVYPAAIEAVLAEHPAVEEACVFGIPDAEWGEVVAASLRFRPGAAATPEQLQEHVRGRLAGFKVPRQIHLVTEFPRTAAGKVIRHRVRSIALSDLKR